MTPPPAMTTCCGFLWVDRARADAAQAAISSRFGNGASLSVRAWSAPGFMTARAAVFAAPSAFPATSGRKRLPERSEVRELALRTTELASGRNTLVLQLLRKYVAGAIRAHKR